MDVTLESGMTVTTYSPPTGFDPLKATNAELVRNGFPRRPGDPELLARWNRVFRELDGKLNYVTPTFERVPHVREPRLKRAPRTETTGDTETNDHWSGVQVLQGSGQSFYSLTADLWVPRISAPDTTQAYWLMSWIGIDGEASDNVLCQIGIAQNINVAGPGTQQCYAFWEWYSAPAYQVGGFVVNPGDLVSLTLCSQGEGSTHATGYYANLTTGAATSYTLHMDNENPLIGHCAEWVVERPQINDVPALLPDYGQTYFYDCIAAVGYPNWTSVYAATGTVINMVDGDGNTISEAAVVSPPGTEIHFQYVPQ
jgi:hypothetical protein